MHDAYKMVVVNLISSAILIICVLFYRFVYPKKKINLFVLLILISILPLISIFRPGDYESGDFNIHIYRIMSFYDSLSEGHIMPSWAGELNSSYGNPLFLFNYPLPYYLVSFFHHLGFSFIASMKILLGSTYFFSGIFMYIAMRKIFKIEIAAFAAAVFYLFNPYHLIDLHFRATPGESTLFMIAPLLFYFIACFLQEKKVKYLILISLVTVLLSLAHPLVSLPVFGLVVLFILTLRGVKKRIKTLLYLFIAFAVGVLASLYVWIPFLFFSHIAFQDPSGALVFNPFSDLFFSPYRFGLLFQGNIGQLVNAIGYSQLIVVIVGLVLFIKTDFFRKLTMQYLIWFIILAILILLMHPASNIIWQHFKMLWILEGRLPFPMTFCTSIIAGYLALYFSKSKKNYTFIFIFLFLTLLSTMLNWGHRHLITDITDKQLRQGVGSSTIVEGTAVWFLNTKWADKNHLWFDKPPKEHLEILKGNAQVKELSRTSTGHTYVVNASTPITIRESTLWYPGWSLKSNGKYVKIYPGKSGIINAKLPSGLQYITLTYQDIPVIKALKIISVTTALILLLLLAGTLFGHPKYLSRDL